MSRWRGACWLLGSWLTCTWRFGRWRTCSCSGGAHGGIGSCGSKILSLTPATVGASQTVQSQPEGGSGSTWCYRSARRWARGSWGSAADGDHGGRPILPSCWDTRTKWCSVLSSLPPWSSKVKSRLPTVSQVKESLDLEGDWRRGTVVGGRRAVATCPMGLHEDAAPCPGGDRPSRAATVACGKRPTRSGRGGVRSSLGIDGCDGWLVGQCGWGAGRMGGG